MTTPRPRPRLKSLTIVMVAVLVAGLSAVCGSDQKVYPPGRFGLAGDAFLSPGEYDVEEVGDQACVVASMHGPGYSDRSDWVYAFMDFKDGASGDPETLTISPGDTSILVEYARCRLTRK